MNSGGKIAVRKSFEADEIIADDMLRCTAVCDGNQGGVKEQNFSTSLLAVYREVYFLEKDTNKVEKCIELILDDKVFKKNVHNFHI